MASILRKLLVKRRALVVLGVIVLLWVLFLDSHSVFNRIRWSRQLDELQEKNQKMEQVITQAEEELEHRNDEKEIERIARESYGMRRDGETVYRVEDQGD